MAPASLWAPVDQSSPVWALDLVGRAKLSGTVPLQTLRSSRATGHTPCSMDSRLQVPGRQSRGAALLCWFPALTPCRAPALPFPHHLPIPVLGLPSNITNTRVAWLLPPHRRVPHLHPLCKLPF